MKRPKAPKNNFCLLRPESGTVIDVNNRSKKTVPSFETFRRLILFVLKAEGVRQARISLQLVNDAAMKKLNRTFKGRRLTTDVLSFDLTGRGSSSFVFTDIVISVDTACRKAGELSVSPEEEMMRYVVHGLLHNLDYDDLKPVQRKRMWKRQEELLRKFKK